MKEPVTKNLKELDNGVLRLLKHVVHMNFGAERHPVTILLGSIFTEDMPTSNGGLRSADITEENILERRWQACHISGDCWGEKVVEDKGRKMSGAQWNVLEESPVLTP